MYKILVLGPIIFTGKSRGPEMNFLGSTFDLYCEYCKTWTNERTNKQTNIYGLIPNISFI